MPVRSLGWPFLAVLVACQSQTSGVAPGPEKNPSAGEQRTGAKRDRGAQLYEVVGLVLDKQGVGPRLCIGAVLDSLPPQCAGPGIPLPGWDWAEVAGEKRALGTTWGDYRIVGTYDGHRMTPTEPPGPPRRAHGDDAPPHMPCGEPKGGWTRPDPNKMGQTDLTRANLAAQSLPGYAGFWMHYLVPRKSEHYDLKNVVVVATFTGDLTAREAALRQVWGGALCVARQKYSEVELGAIRSEAEAMMRRLGLQLQGSDMDVSRGTIDVAVTTATPEQLATLERKYGNQLVVTALMRPLP